LYFRPPPGGVGPSEIPGNKRFPMTLRRMMSFLENESGNCPQRTPLQFTPWASLYRHFFLLFSKSRIRPPMQFPRSLRSKKSSSSCISSTNVDPHDHRNFFQKSPLAQMSAPLVCSVSSVFFFRRARKSRRRDQKFGNHIDPSARVICPSG